MDKFPYPAKPHFLKLQFEMLYYLDMHKERSIRTIEPAPPQAKQN